MFLLGNSIQVDTVQCLLIAADVFLSWKLYLRRCRDNSEGWNRKKSNQNIGSQTLANLGIQNPPTWFSGKWVYLQD